MTGKPHALGRDHLVAEHRSGAPAGQLASKYGVSHKVIVRVLGDAYMTRSQIVASFSDAVIARYTAGESENAIAKDMPFNRGAVRRILIDNGVHVRGQSESEALKWIQMSEAQREQQVTAAHEATRGVSRSQEELCKRAKTREAKGAPDTPLESEVISALEQRGIACFPQTAVGPYNCDITSGPVAVEIWGGHWHWAGRHLARTEERFRYIMDRGWNILVIPVNQTSPFTAAVADYIVAHVKGCRADPPRPCEYRVVWRAGEFSTGGRADDNHVSVEPPFTSRRNPTTGQYETIAR